MAQCFVPCTPLHSTPVPPLARAEGHLIHSPNNTESQATGQQHGMAQERKEAGSSNTGAQGCTCVCEGVGVGLFFVDTLVKMH